MQTHAVVTASLQYPGLVLTHAGLPCCNVTDMSWLPAVSA